MARIGVVKATRKVGSCEKRATLARDDLNQTATLLANAINRAIMSAEAARKAKSRGAIMKSREARVDTEMAATPAGEEAKAALDKARAQAQVKSKRAAICRKTENALREAQAELLRSELAQNK